MTNFYVDGLVGDDSNTGGAAGAGFAVATIKAGIGKMTDGGTDHLYVKASTVYNESVTFNINGDTGALTLMTIEGYDTSPGDGGIVTLNGGGTLNYGFAPGTSSGFMEIKNFYITDYASDGFYSPSPDYFILRDITCHANGNDGFRLDNYCRLINCSATSNTGNGVDYDSYTWIIGGTWRDNGEWNIYNFGDGTRQTITGAIIARGGLGNVYMTCGDFIHNTVDGGGTASGLFFNPTNNVGGYCVINNIFYNCVTGIVGPAITRGVGHTTYNNLFDACTTTYLRWTDRGTDVHDTAGLNSDYTLSATSAALGAGFVTDHQPSGYTVDIGAIQSAPATGGSSRVVLTS